MRLRENLDRLERDYRIYKTLPALMTMPRIPFIYIYLNGKYHSEWKLHDMHYGVDYPISRKESDLFLYEGICQKSPGAITKMFAIGVYVAVRTFGWYHFNTKD